jgi:hypothetical protein
MLTGNDSGVVAGLERFQISSESKSISRYLIYRIFLTRTGIHFARKCSSVYSSSRSWREKTTSVCSTIGVWIRRGAMGDWR